MKILEFEHWKNVPVKLGLVASVLVALTAAWLFMNSYFLPVAVAAEVRLPNVQERIEDMELKKIEVKHREDLPDKVKEEYLIRLELKIKKLEKESKCLESGKVKCKD